MIAHTYAFCDEFLHIWSIGNAANIDSAYAQRLVLQTVVVSEKCFQLQLPVKGKVSQ